MASASFFSLSKALKKGDARHIPDKVKEKNQSTIAYDLYEAVRKYYDTDATCSHHTLYAFNKFAELRLDHTTAVSEFIAGWKRIVSPLKQNHSSLVSNRDLLRCFLLQAIVSDAYGDV